MPSSSYIIEAAQPLLLLNSGTLTATFTQPLFSNDFTIPYTTNMIIKIITQSTTQVKMKYQTSAGGSAIAYINNGFPLYQNTWNEFSFYVTIGDKINFYPVIQCEMHVLLFANAPAGGGAIG